jgi:hypothetical protein
VLFSPFGQPADARAGAVQVRTRAEEALAHLLAIPHPAAAYIGGMSALTWQYPSDQAARPGGRRRGGSEGERGVDPTELRLHRTDLSDTW